MRAVFSVQCSFPVHDCMGSHLSAEPTFLVFWFSARSRRMFLSVAPVHFGAPRACECTRCLADPLFQRSKLVPRPVMSVGLQLSPTFLCGAIQGAAWARTLSR